jgi:hypothetical protein
MTKKIGYKYLLANQINNFTIGISRVQVKCVRLARTTPLALHVFLAQTLSREWIAYL